MRQEANRQFKDSIRANVDATKRNYEEKVRRDVDYFKHEKREQKDFMQVQKHQEQIKNH